MTLARPVLTAISLSLSLLLPLLPVAATAHVSPVGPGGYYWVDDRQPGHAFQDPKFLEPQILTLQGSATSPIALPFTFRYFGKPYDHVEATADGRLVLRFLGGERQRMADDGSPRVDIIPARPDIAVLDVFGGVRPTASSSIVFNVSPDDFVTLRWSSFEAGPAAPITFEAYLRADGAIRFQYWQMDALFNSASYGLVGDIGLRDPNGAPGQPIMRQGNPAPGFSLRTASVIDFGREVPDLPGPRPEPKTTQCPPAFGLPSDFPTWCDRTRAGDDRVLGTADDKDACLANTSGGPYTPCTTSMTTQWDFDEDLFCAGCPYTFYVVVDCGPDIHLPSTDVEAMRVSIIDLNTGLAQVITAENECIKKRDRGIDWPYCDNCASFGLIAPKEDPVPGIGKPAGSCMTASGLSPEIPCLAYRETALSVGWGTPINQATPDANGNTIIDADEMDSPPCQNCDGGTVPACDCGTSTGANRVTESADIDVILLGTPTLSGVYRLELLSGGNVWSLFSNCDGTATPLYNIYDTCAEALLGYNPLAELALSSNPAIAFSAADETNCPATVRFGVTMCNGGGRATEPVAPSAPFTIRFFSGATQVGTPFNGDMISATNCDFGTGMPLDINECRTCYFDVPVGGSDRIAEITIDRNFQVNECSETPSGVRCGIDPGLRTRRIPVCPIPCVATASAQVSGSPFCRGASVTIDASGSTITGCAGAIEYRYEEYDFTTGTWIVLSDYSTSDSTTYTPPTDGAKRVRVRVRCASEVTCNSTSTPVNFTVATDTDDDGVSDSCGDLCPDVPNINTVATDCNADGDTLDVGEAIGEQCDRDADGVGDPCDNCPDTANPINTAPTDCNADGDTLDAGEAIGEQCPCPVVDTDGDTIPDASDNCPLAPNPGQEDQDSDGLGDHCDDSDGDGILDSDELRGGTDPNLPDTDTDGVLDGVDNCPRTPNTQQDDFDLDGFGDLCDDFDVDGIFDGLDNCRLLVNPAQGDIDGDGIGDICDDSDADGIFDDVDNCRVTPNGAQIDSDGDGVGDACEDSDSDGVLDVVDNCVITPNGSQTDADGDGVGDACEPGARDVLIRLWRVDSETSRFDWERVDSNDGHDLYAGDLADLGPPGSDFAHDTALACGLPQGPGSQNILDAGSDGRSRYYLMSVRFPGPDELGVNSFGTPHPASGAVPGCP